MNLRKLIVKPEAEEDLLLAYEWYEIRRPGLGDDFLMSVEATFERIKRNPNEFILKYKEVRRARLNRFPYIILFTKENELLVVLAVIHDKRDPDFFHNKSIGK
jgi:plasmid stabilization system protein ParE